MESYSQYQEYRKPSWAPPAWLFAPVWTFLYVLIAISFGYTVILYVRKALPFIVLLPFLLNLVFNLAYTPIQFRLRNFKLGLADVLLVLATLVWGLISVYPYAHWVLYINIPYVLWATFATVLQASVTIMNWRGDDAIQK